MNKNYGIQKVENTVAHDLHKYEGLIPDTSFEVSATSEAEAIVLIIDQIRNKFNTMSNNQLEEEFGIIAWRKKTSEAYK